MKIITKFLVLMISVLLACTDQNVLVNNTPKESASLNVPGQAGVVKPLSDCSPTSHCAAGWGCFNGQCFQLCPCPAGSTCNGSYCVPVTCSPACTTGYTCVNGVCTTPGCTVCSAFYSGNYSTINSYHQYPRQNVDVSCLIAGEIITLSCAALDVPNRFTVYDGNGNYVTGSAWIGNANYPGPWGQSLLTVGTTMFSFAKSTSSYQILVETQTPPNYSYSPNTDYWSVAVGCHQP